MVYIYVKIISEGIVQMIHEGISTPKEHHLGKGIIKTIIENEVYIKSSKFLMSNDNLLSPL